MVYIDYFKTSHFISISNEIVVHFLFTNSSSFKLHQKQTNDTFEILISVDQLINNKDWICIGILSLNFLRNDNFCLFFKHL